MQPKNTIHRLSALDFCRCRPGPLLSAFTRGLVGQAETVEPAATQLLHRGRRLSRLNM